LVNIIFKNKTNIKILKILIWSKENNKKISNFFQSIFEMQKQTCFNKEIQPNLKWKKNFITQLLYNIKQIHINLFSLYSMKKKLIRENKKNFKREKNKIGNILKYFYKNILR
jgi:transcriptional regulator of heat shock response